MSVEIEEVTIGSETEKRLVLSNAQWAATLAIGTDWDILRVGARLAWGDPGGNIGGTPRFYFGVHASPSSGFANGPLSGSSTSHFLGFASNQATWTRNAGPPVFLSFASTTHGGKKVGATLTNFGGDFGHFMSAAPTTFRVCFMVEIEKGSPNFTVRWSSYTGALTDDTVTTLLSAMDNSSFASAAAQIGASDASATTAVDESSDGFFNAIAVAWDRSVVPVYVSEMFYAKYA